MKTKLGILAFALVASFAAPAWAKPVEVSADLEPGEPVRVDIAYGRIEIVGSTAGRIRVTGEIDEALERVTLRRDGGSMEARVRFPLLTRLRTLWHDVPVYRADLRIELPADTPLFVVSRDADLEISGVEGPVGVGVVSSTVVVRGTPARLALDSVSGSMEFDGTTRRLRASTLSGRLVASGVEGVLDLEAGTGSLEVQRSRISRATLATVSGDVVFRGVIDSEGSLEVETESGTVTLECRGAPGLDIDLVTREGEILNQASGDEPVREASGYRALKVALDGGGAAARVRTRSGLIRLVRPSGPGP